MYCETFPSGKIVQMCRPYKCIGHTQCLPYYVFDVDPGQRGPCVVAAIDTFTRTAEILWRKRDGMAALSVRERALTPAWTGFYCFSGHIT